MNMNKSAFIKQLRATANELTPLAKSAVAGGLAWNGTEYAKADDIRSFDPNAHSWQVVLRAIADLLEAQESPFSQKQIEYLKRILFGGMGSLNDLSFDPKSRG